jgi:uncharacterized protein DUF4062/TIR domain-containing protein
VNPDRRSPPRRVFISHTSELRRYPAGRSFVAAAESAIARAGDAVIDMAYFAARDQKSSEAVRQAVRQSDIFIGLVGFRYGSRVRDMPETPYAELEYEAASDARIPRLIFILSEDTTGPADLFRDVEFGARQYAFRSRLLTGSSTTVTVSSTDELETAVLHSLTMLEPIMSRAGHRPAGDSPQRIFISHATADRPLVDNIIDFMVFAGVPENAIYYSAQRSTGTPTGMAFVEYVKRQLKDASLVIQVITETYLMQPFCLAELGAQWALDSRSFPIAVPPVTSIHVSGLLAGVQVSILSDETAQELYGVLTSELGFNLSSTLYDRAYRRVLQDIPGLVAQLPPTPPVARALLEDSKRQLASVTAELNLLKARLQQHGNSDFV